MFRCDRCGADFESPRVIDHSYYDPFDYVCQKCGSYDFTEGHYCKGCGEFIEEEGFAIDDYCDKCLEDAITALKAHLTNDRCMMTEKQKQIYLAYMECI